MHFIEQAYVFDDLYPNTYNPTNKIVFCDSVNVARKLITFVDIFFQQPEAGTDSDR